MVSVRCMLIFGVIQILHVEASFPMRKMNLRTVIPHLFRSKSKRVTQNQVTELQQHLDDYIKEQSEQTSSMAAKMKQMEAVLQKHSKANVDRQNVEKNMNTRLDIIEKRISSLTTNKATETFKKNVGIKLERLQTKISTITSNVDMVTAIDTRVGVALKTLSALDDRIGSAEEFLDRLRDAPDCPLAFQWDKKSKLCAVVNTAPVSKADVTCRKYGDNTRLVIPDTKAKLEAIKSFIIKSKVNLSPFLGGKMSIFYGDFYWDNGKSILTGWCPHSPTTHKSCLVMNASRDFCFEDVDCEQRYPYICELKK